MIAPPEYFLNAYDSHALAAPILRVLANGPAWAAEALCALAAAAALATVAARCRTLGLGVAGTSAALLLVALCAGARFELTFQPFEWLLAGLIILVLGSRRQLRWIALPLVLTWAILFDSATIGAGIVVLYAAGRRKDGALAVAAAAASLLTPHGFSLDFSGARALYLDALLPGADRVALWTSPWTLPGIGVFAIVALTAAGGLARIRRADTLLFAGLLICTMADARMAPFFALAAAPCAVEAFLDWIHVNRREAVPAMGVLCTVTLLATALVALSPHPPTARRGADQLLDALGNTGGKHRVICLQAAWCDPVAKFPSVTALVYGRAAASTRAQRRLQQQIAAGSIDYSAAVGHARADAVIAYTQAPIVQVLAASHRWRAVAKDRYDRVLLVHSR